MKTKTNLIEAHVIRKTENGIEYLLLKRSPNKKYPNIWQMVTGKIIDGEKAFETAEREIGEETNLKIEHLYIVPNVNSFYNSYDNSITLISVFVAVVNYKEIITISNEHSEFKWGNSKEARKLLAWPGQEKSVKYIEQYFGKKKENLNFIPIF